VISPVLGEFIFLKNKPLKSVSLCERVNSVQYVFDRSSVKNMTATAQMYIFIASKYSVTSNEVLYLC
jgi:hypothetical protein